MSEMQVKTKKVRLDYIDILRGFGILFMVMGHVGYGDVFDKYIHAFHMPLFILVSGYFFRKDENNTFNFIKRKAKTLLLPYFCFAILHYLIFIIFTWQKQNINHYIVLRSFLYFNTDGNMPIAGALWFLTCLFLIEITFNFILKICKRKATILVIIIVISALGSIYPLLTNVRLPYAADTALVGLGIFYIGYIVKEFESVNKCIHKLVNLSIVEVVSLFIISSVLIFTNGPVNMRTLEYAIIPLFWINCILGTIIYWNIGKYMAEFKNDFVKWVNRELIYIGKNSIVYLCLNQLCIWLISTFIGRIATYNTIMGNLLIKFVITIIALICLHITANIINRTRLKILIGK